MPGIRAVVFDVGGTLVDEWRLFTGWAETLGVPVGDFYAALGSVIERRGHHREVFDLVAPGADLPRLRAGRVARGVEFAIRPEDLYPDAVDCVRECRTAGLFVGIVGNQKAGVDVALADCGLGCDLLATSEGWGVEKPDPAFFTRLATECGMAAGEIAYLGDRVDNDVLPARAFGMVPVLLRRGPWGVIHAAWPEARAAALVVADLHGLPAKLAAL